jgi:hypothetical protein
MVDVVDVALAHGVGVSRRLDFMAMIYGGGDDGDSPAQYEAQQVRDTQSTMSAGVSKEK